MTLVPGWFNESVPPYFAQHNEPVAFVHVDCDLYSSTKTVLDAVGPRLAPRAVIVFDEFFNYPGYKHHEFKAFHEWVASSGAKYEFLGWSGASVSLQLTT